MLPKVLCPRTAKLYAYLTDGMQSLASLVAGLKSGAMTDMPTTSHRSKQGAQLRMPHHFRKRSSGTLLCNVQGSQGAPTHPGNNANSSALRLVSTTAAPAVRPRWLDHRSSTTDEAPGGCIHEGWHPALQEVVAASKANYTHASRQTYEHSDNILHLTSGFTSGGSQNSPNTAKLPSWCTQVWHERVAPRRR